jgi:hypothetical protein
MHQRVRRVSTYPIPWLLAILGLAPIAAAEGPAAAIPETQSGVARPRAELEMQGLFEAITPLLPLAMESKAWSNPANQAAIQARLDNLIMAGASLEAHATRRDLGYRALSRSLVLDMTEARERYRERDFERSRTAMVEITNTCAACHARLPGASDTARQALPENQMAELSLHQQSQVWVATRRFDRALAAFETAFSDEMQAPGHLDMEGYLLDYMTLGLRVSQDPTRVRRTFALLAERPDMPIYLGRHLAGWDLALAAIEDDLNDDAPLARGRALAAGENVPRPALLGREQTVYDLVASSLLLRFIDANVGGPEELAEAYYLLGVVEARSVDSYWLPQAEDHLEAAIRLAPASASAASAYALLEEYVVVGFGGANGDALPDEAWEKLRVLGQLIEESRSPAASELEILP